MAPAGEYHTPNATFGTTVGPPPRSSASRASSPLSVSLPSLSLTRFFPLEFCQAFRLPPSHYSRFLFSLLFSISIDVFFGRSFSRFFLFTHHLSSLVLQLSFTLSLSLFTPFLLFLSLSSAWPTYTLFLLSRIFYRALPRRTLLLSEFPVISRPQRGTPKQLPFLLLLL